MLKRFSVGLIVTILLSLGPIFSPPRALAQRGSKKRIQLTDEQVQRLKRKDSRSRLRRERQATPLPRPRDLSRPIVLVDKSAPMQTAGTAMDRSIGS